MIALFVLCAGFVYAIYVMFVCLAATFLFLLQMIFEGAQALGAAAEKANEKKVKEGKV